LAGRNHNNTGFGNLTHLNPINDTSTITTNNKVPKPTRTIKISEQLFRRFVGHSRRYYNVESYELILSNLLDNFEKNNHDTRWYNNIEK
jgi:hypothetical protein